jgi:hypothetical protein
MVMVMHDSAVLLARVHSLTITDSVENKAVGDVWIEYLSNFVAEYLSNFVAEYLSNFVAAILAMQAISPRLRRSNRNNKSVDICLYVRILVHFLVPQRNVHVFVFVHVQKKAHSKTHTYKPRLIV